MNISTILNINLGDEELFCENGGENCSSFNLADEVVSTLKHQIVGELAAKISKPQIELLKEEIANRSDIEVVNFMNVEVSKAFDTVLVPSRYGQTTLKKHVETKLTEFMTDKKMSEILTNIANEAVVAIKEKYDMFYTMQLLKKISQAGLLKDDSIVKDFNANTVA